MARSKSSTESKVNRAKPNGAGVKETAGAGSLASVPEAKAMVSETVRPAVKTETKAARTKAEKTGAASQTGKVEAGKPEAGKNVLPTNLEEEIRRRAYELYEQRGKASGTGGEADDWLAAEREVRQRYHQHSAGATA
jgi:hypothetical protein